MKIMQYGKQSLSIRVDNHVDEIGDYNGKKHHRQLIKMEKIEVPKFDEFTKKRNETNI